jgi:hypothetical protein
MGMKSLFLLVLLKLKKGNDAKKRKDPFCRHYSTSKNEMKFLSR